MGNMIKMNLPGIIDQHIPRQGPQAHLIWGWTATIWLAYILTEGDHRKVCVVDYIRAMQHREGRRYPTVAAATPTPLATNDQ
jgi:transposase